MVAVVSWLALGVAAASLLWQVLSWMHSGPRLHVQFEHVLEGRLFGVPSPRGREPREAYAVTVTNDGRQAVTVQEVGLEYRERGRSAREARDLRLVVWGEESAGFRSAPLPVRLQPGASLSVFCSATSLKDYLAYIEKVGVEEYRVSVGHNGSLIAKARAGTRWFRGDWRQSRRGPRPGELLVDGAD